MNTSRILRAFGALSLSLAVAGCSGEDGKDGKDGKNGVDGAQGPKGDPGADGAKGADGTNGVDGTNGMDGTNGVDGVDGVDGMDGANGANGADGTNGTNGTNGMDGASGIIDRTKLTGKSVIYPLAAEQTSGVTGSVRFAEFVDGATQGTLVTIRIKGSLTPDTIRNAHIHYNSTVTGGAPAVTLNKVDGFTADGTAFSETLVTKVNATATNAADATEVFVSGHAITYTDLVGTGVMGSNTGFNGYVNVHVITTDPVANTAATAAVVSGNIGKNY
jgi:hypothetical protein